MSNPSKKKGTAAETAVVHHARGHGFPWADRQPLRGNRDAGDITLAPGVIAEVKNHALPTGHPTPGQLDEWMRQTILEQNIAGADVGILIVKRRGTRDVGRWHAYVTAWTLAEIVHGDSINPVSDHAAAPVCLAVDPLLELLRAAGWGDAPAVSCPHTCGCTSDVECPHYECPCEGDQ